jgi:MFS family permease
MSTHHLTRVPEPVMTAAGPPATIWQKLRAPFCDSNFRRLIVFVGSWNVASNIAAPFIAVYLLQQLWFPLSTVMILTVMSQVANALTLYLWGRVSDRLSNKGILAVALPIYFASLFGLVFSAVPEPHFMTLPLLVLVHVFMGAAAGGIGLACGNISLKLAPHGEATAYLAAVSLTVSLAGGAAPMLGGALAEFLDVAQLSIVVRWASGLLSDEVAVLRFAHWEFLFGISVLAGFYVMHRLSLVREGHEVAQREVVQELSFEAARSINQLSSVGGLVGGLVSFGRLIERRLVRRN